jgi:hypothetical protein
MKIEQVFTLYEDKKAAEKKVQELNKQYQDSLQNYMTEYFNGKIPHHLPISKNQFISIHSNNFVLAKGEKGKIFWTATGSLVTVKDGQVTYGHAKKTIYQGEFEAMPENLRNNTLENAKYLSTPVFPIVPQNYGGVGYANYGFELARNEELALLLVWRKAGTSYIDRGTGSLAAQSSLQILEDARSSLKHEQRSANRQAFIERQNLQPESVNLVKKVDRSRYVEIVEGGKLNKDVILKYDNIINDVFGDGAVNTIVTKMLEQSNKLKSIKNQGVTEIVKEETKVVPPGDIEEFMLNGKKWKV